MRETMTVLASALLLAGCSSLSCDFPEANPATSVRSSSYYSALQSERRLDPSVEIHAEDDDVVGSIPPDPARALKETELPNRNSAFILKNPKLFSAAEDHRPWPLVGSPEAKKQEEDDKRREEDVKKIVEICRC